MSSVFKAFVLDGTSWDIRILYDSRTKPLFCANDVGTVLGIRNIRSSMQDFDSDEKVTEVFHTPGGPQEMLFLTRDGLFRLLMRSNKPIARPFQKWVSKVVGEIEDNGGYELQRSFEEECRAIEERYKEKVDMTRHDTLIEAYHRKHVVYFCKIKNMEDAGKFIVKIGSTGDLSTRVSSLAREYECDPIVMDVVECRQHVKLEALLHNHEVIAPYCYRGEICKDRKSHECFVVDTELVSRFVSIARRNVRKCELPDEAFFELQKSKLDIEKKKLDVKLEELKLNQANMDQSPDEIAPVEDDVIPENTEESDDETFDMHTFESLVKTTARKTVRGPKVQKYDPESKELICTYDGLLEACRHIGNGATPNAMKTAAQERRLYRDFRWYLLDRESANDSVADIGETCSSSHAVHAKDYVVLLNLDKTRIEKVFPDQKSASEFCKFKSVSAISCAIKRGSKTCGHYANFWSKCSEELRTEYLSRDVLPELPSRQGSRGILQLHPITKNVVKKYNSIQDVIRDHKVSRRSLLQSVDVEIICHGFFWKFE